MYHEFMMRLPIGLSLFFTNFFRNHIQVIEQPITRPNDEAHMALMTGMLGIEDNVILSMEERVDSCIISMYLYMYIITDDSKLLM